MLEAPENIGGLIGAIAIAASLVFIGYQLILIRRQMVADAMQDRVNMRLAIWTAKLDQEARLAAAEKFFEHELYKRDVTPYELDELTWREKQAIVHQHEIELIYFQNLFNQRKVGNISTDQCLTLDRMFFFRDAPNRRRWKDFNRLSGHFPDDFVQHVDSVVKKFDEVEDRMDMDQDADFGTMVQEVFNIPAPPNWLDS